MTPRPILLHVGYPKTATSWLQHRVFAGDSFCEPWPTSGNRILEEVCWRPEADFDPQTVRAAFDQDLERLCPEPHRIAVISHEVLVGDPTRQLYWGDLTALRLYRTFPEAKVLVTIREQGSMAYAVWAEAVRRGERRSLSSLLLSGADEGAGYRARLTPEFLRYSGMIRLYGQLFGRKNVLVLPIEALRKAPEAYLSRLTGFLDRPLGVKPGSEDAVWQSFPPQALSVLRALNAITDPGRAVHGSGLKRHYLAERMAKRVPDGWARRKKQKDVARVASRLRDEVREDNAKLAAYTDFDIAAYDYAMPSE